jgi:hypothetical protein
LLGRLCTDQIIIVEGRTIDALRKHGHENLVKVLYHDWLPQDSTFYFIDIELCLYDLDHHIQAGNTQLSEFLSREGSESQFLKRVRDTMEIAKGLAA